MTGPLVIDGRFAVADDGSLATDECPDCHCDGGGGGPDLVCCGPSDIAFPDSPLGLGTSGTLSYEITYALTDNASWRGASEPPVSQRVLVGGGSTTFFQRCQSVIPDFPRVDPDPVLLGVFERTPTDTYAIRYDSTATYARLDGSVIGAGLTALFTKHEFPPFDDPRGWRRIGPGFGISFSINVLTGETLVDDDGGWAAGPPSLSVIAGSNGALRGGTLSLSGARVDGNGDTIANVSGSLTVVLDAIGRCGTGAVLPPGGLGGLGSLRDPGAADAIARQLGGCDGCGDSPLGGL